MRVNLMDYARAPTRKTVTSSNAFAALAEDEEEDLEDNDVMGIPAANLETTWTPPPPTASTSMKTNRRRNNTQRPQLSIKKAFESNEDQCSGVGCCQEIHSLFDSELDLGSLQQERQWMKIESVMDSGAAESVAPPDIAPWIAAEESEGSKRGQTYVSASGDRLPNLGEKKLKVTTAEGNRATATYQLADVTRPLCSISKVCDRGNAVTFTAEGGYITNKSGEVTKFRRQNNVYVLDMYVRNPNETESCRRTSGFTRPSM